MYTNLIVYISTQNVGIQHGVVSVRTRVGDGQSGSNPGRGRKCFLLYNAQSGSGTHPASCSVGTRVLSWMKRLSNDVDRSPVLSARGKNEWGCASAPHVCLRDLDRDNLTVNFTFTFTFQNISSICFKWIKYKNWLSAVHMLELHHHILSHKTGKLNQQYVTDRFRNYL
jgi:hypothetical protein